MRKWPEVPVDENGLSTRTDLALDSVYRNRWIEFHMADGTVKDSRLINWRHVMWDQVVKLAVSIRGKRHELTMNLKPGFKCFLCYRRVCAVNTPQEAQQWIIGWTNGDLAFLLPIEFMTGERGDPFVKKLDDILGHVHPRCRAACDA